VRPIARAASGWAAADRTSTLNGVNGLRAWLAQHPPNDSNYRQSLAGVARRARQGDDFWIAVRELQDELSLTQTDAQRARAIAEAPPLTGEPASMPSAYPIVSAGRIMPRRR